MPPSLLALVVLSLVSIILLSLQVIFSRNALPPLLPSFSLSLSLSLTHTHIWWTPLQYLTGASVIKYLPTNAGDTRDASSIYGSGRSLEVRNDNPRQCSCLENPMDRGAAGVIVHKVAQSQIQLSPHLYHSSTYSVSLYFCTWLLSSHF